MMALTIGNFTKTVPAELLKRAAKHKIRECEEVEKGKYIAFAEDGDQDFDVSVSTSGNEKITTHSCDCNEKTPVCSHIIALLLYLTSNKLPKTRKVKPSKKQTASEITLEETPGDEIKIWLRDLFLKNKDLEMLFLSRFSKTTQTFTVEEVKKVTLDVIKTVVKSRRLIEKSEAKKISEMWKEVHKPIIEFYHSRPSGEPNFGVFITLAETCLDFAMELRKNDGDITKYFHQLFKTTEKMLLELKSEDEWDESTQLLINQISLEKSLTRYNVLSCCLDLYMNCTEPRKSSILKKIMVGFQKYENSTKRKDRNFQQMILPVLSTSDGTFQTYYSHFVSLVYQPKYNHELIRKLIEIQQWERAEDFCETEIKNNLKDEYNISYFGFLHTIYKATGNDKKLLLLLTKSVPVTFDFEGYQLCMASFETDVQRKEFRNKVLSKVRHSIDPAARNFHFELLAFEKNYSKMLQSITQYTPYSIVLKYWDELREVSHSEFLRYVLFVANENVPYRDEEKVTSFYPILLEKILQNYEPSAILSAIKSQGRSWGYFPFLDYIKKHLQS